MRGDHRDRRARLVGARGVPGPQRVRRVVLGVRQTGGPCPLAHHIGHRVGAHALARPTVPVHRPQQPPRGDATFDEGDRQARTSHTGHVSACWPYGIATSVTVGHDHRRTVTPSLSEKMSRENSAKQGGTVGTAIVTGIFTLIAGLGGVWLTQRHVAREAHRGRVEARRDEQRQVVSELLIAGRDKVGRYEVLLPAFSKFSTADMNEYIETDTGRELRQINTEMNRALVQASLLVGDSAIAVAIADVRVLDLQFPTRP